MDFLFTFYDVVSLNATQPIAMPNYSSVVRSMVGNKGNIPIRWRRFC